MREPNLLDITRLVDWIDGRLTDTETRAVAEQVARADAEVQASVRWLRAFRAVSRRVVLASPPASTRAALRRRFDLYARGRRAPALVRRVVAALTYDSLRQPALAGQRAGGAGPRQLIYATDIADVALHIQWSAATQRFDMSGQMFAKALVAIGGFEAQLLRGPQAVAEADVDDLGEFWFRALQPGRYEVALVSPAHHVILPQVELLG